MFAKKNSHLLIFLNYLLAPETWWYNLLAKGILGGFCNEKD